MRPSKNKGSAFDFNPPYLVLLAGHPILCAELRQRLVHEPRFIVLKQTVQHSADLRQLLEKTGPDILLMDMTLPTLDPLVVLGEFKTEGGQKPSILVIAPSYIPHLEEAEAFRPPVRGVLLRRMALTPLIRPVLRGIAAGSQYVVPAPPLHVETQLTAYEYEVALLMTLGLDNAEIAGKTGRPVMSVYNAQVKVRRKLGAKSNAEAAIGAIRCGLAGLLTTPEGVQPADDTEYQGQHLTV